MRELRDYAEGAIEKGALAVMLVGSLARGITQRSPMRT